MTCTSCTEPRVYDLTCQSCCTRLVASARSTAAPRVAKAQQLGMLALVDRMPGKCSAESTISELKGERA